MLPDGNAISNFFLSGEVLSSRITRSSPKLIPKIQVPLASTLST